MTAKQLTEKIVKKLKILAWKELVLLGINAQQQQKIKNGKPVTFRAVTLERLRVKLKIVE